tara:strand:+ start:741 stop:1370 length:630 start_codon:yes stop_codon:yes gene_type:complete
MEISFSYSIPPKPSALPGLEHLSGRFMYAILFWNHAETTLKQIVQLLLGQSQISMSVASEMGNRSIVQAIQVGSKVPELEHLAEHLRHICEGFTRLLGYRNFYVHGIYAIEQVDGLAAIRILSVKGDGSFKMFNPIVTANDIDEFQGHVHKLIGYGVAIQKALGADGDGLEAMVERYEASLEKPEWPKPLKKVPLNLQGLVNQPLSSET